MLGRCLGLLGAVAGTLLVSVAACDSETETGTGGTTAATGGTGGTSSGGGTAGSGGAGGEGAGPGSCAEPLPLTVPASVDGDTTGAGNVTDAACSSPAGSGPEMVYELTPDSDQTLLITLQTPAAAGTGGSGPAGADLGVSLRTTCLDSHSCCHAATTAGCSDQTIQDCVCALDSYCCDTQWDSECVEQAQADCAVVCPTVACADAVAGQGEEWLIADVVANETYYVQVDGNHAGEVGTYTLTISELSNESGVDCTNLLDDDHDGLIDCADPTDCQSEAACAPGGSAHGAACTANTDCLANSNDPVCLTEADLGYPGGYCSEFCDPVADDCGTDAICLDFGADICIKTCTQDSDCRQPQYSCQDLGQASNVCLPDSCAAPETASAGDNTGDTSEGLSTYGGSCIGGGNPEDVWLYHSPTGPAGTLTVTLSAVEDLGIYVRTDCGDETSEVAGGCVDSEWGGTDEVLTLSGSAGNTDYFIFVDSDPSLTPNGGGPYTLSIQWN